MKITEQDVRYVAGLAHLELSEVEIQRLAADMDAILTYVDKLNELDTSAIEPMAQVLFDAPEDVAIRSDDERPSFAPQKALSNAPESGGGHFKVAKVIER